jgi:hypothetical protein
MYHRLRRLAIETRSPCHRGEPGEVVEDKIGYTNKQHLGQNIYGDYFCVDLEIVIC